MTSSFHDLEAAGVALTLDLSTGMIRRFEVVRDGRTVEPLHTAPWIDEDAIQRDESIPPHLRTLSGDFFCAPFGANDVEPAPMHGWPCNAPWTVLGVERHPGGGVTARYRLDRPVFGARLEKELTLRDGHPFVYQRHVFEGGSGAVTAAHHAMTRMPQGGRLSFSPKRFAETPAVPLETDPAMGRSTLRYPAHAEDLGAIPLAAGGTVDIRDYPVADRSEDFVMLVEAEASRLGWAAALRHGQGDVVLSLKDPAVLPLTLLWLSNGGRDYAPWNGRHRGVLGIEEARCYSAAGHAASIADNPLRRLGVETSFELGPKVEVRAVLGGVPVPSGWSAVDTVEAGPGSLTLRDRSGGTAAMPYDDGFLFA